MKHRITLFAGVYLAITGGAGATELLNNGDFQSGDFTGWTLSDPSGWTFIEPSNFGYGAESGSYYVYAGPLSSAPGTLSETFSDVSGATLTISGWAIGDNTPWIDADGSTTYPNLGQVSYYIDGTPLGSPDLSSGAWINSSFTYVATGSDTFTVQFSNDASYNGLDNFSVTEATSSVPELPTWTLLFLGFVSSAFWGLRGRIRLA